MRARDRDHPGQHGETLSLLNIQKISWALWCMPVIPATQDAEAGELLEPGRQRLQVSQDLSTAFQTGRQSKTLSQNKKQTSKNREESFEEELLLLSTEGQ